MTISESQWMKVMRRMEAQETALQKQLEAATAPFRMADEVLNFCRQEQVRQEKWRRLFEREQFILNLSAPAEAVANIAIAFERIHARVAKADAVSDTIRRQVVEQQRMYERFASISLATSEMFAGLDSFFSNESAFLPLANRLNNLAISAADVCDSVALASESFTNAGEWVMQAPAIQPYSAARSVCVVTGVAVQAADHEADALLDDLDAVLEARLAAVSPSLIEPYRGAVTALKIRTPDWPRHTASSLRTLVDGLMGLLAPDPELEVYLDDPESNKDDGEFTRRARLTYIFREVAHGMYAKMAENDIDMTLATFFPENAAVHELLPVLDGAQAMVLLRRVQGCIATLLATQEQ